jgi:hypothetical protein
MSITASRTLASPSIVAPSVAPRIAACRADALDHRFPHRIADPGKRRGDPGVQALRGVRIALAGRTHAAARIAPACCCRPSGDDLLVGLPHAGRERRICTRSRVESRELAF